MLVPVREGENEKDINTFLESILEVDGGDRGAKGEGEGDDDGEVEDDAERVEELVRVNRAAREIAQDFKRRRLG